MIHVNAASLPRVEELLDEVPVRDSSAPSVKEVANEVHVLPPNRKVHKTAVVHVQLTVVQVDKIRVIAETRSAAHAAKVQKWHPPRCTLLLRGWLAHSLNGRS